MTSDNGKSVWHPRAFDRVRGNFKTEYDYAITSKTLIVGANQSGKSGVLIGARYSLAGVAGWTIGVHGSEVAGFAPRDALRLWNELSGPDGRASFEVLYDQAEQKWTEPEKKPQWKEALAGIKVEDRANVLPLVTMSELLFHGPDLGRRALIDRFGDRGALEPIKLLPDQKLYWDEVRAAVVKALTKQVDGVEVLPDPSEVLVGMNKAFAKRKRDEGKTIAALETSIAARMPILTQQAAGSEQVPLLRAQLDRALQWESAATLRDRLAVLEMDKARFRAEREKSQLTPEAIAKREVDEKAHRAAFENELTVAEASAVDVLQQHESALANWDKAIDTPHDGHRARLVWGTNLIAVLERASDKCPVCKNPFTPEQAQQALSFIRPMVEERQRLLGLAEIQRDAVRTAIAAAKSQHAKSLASIRTRHEAWMQQNAKDRQALERETARLKQEHTRIMTAELEIQKSIGDLGAPATYEGPTSAVLKTEIDRLENASKTKTLLENETEAVRALKVIRDRAKNLEEESKKILGILVAQVKERAEAAVNKYIADGPQAVLDLDKNSWRAVDKAGEARSRHTMCGFEENFLVPALAAAYTEGAPLRILTLDDRDIAGVGFENIERFFGALGNAVDRGWLTQVLVAGNRLEPVLDKIAALGWTVIRIDVATVAPTATATIPSVPTEQAAPAAAPDPFFSSNPFAL